MSWTVIDNGQVTGAARSLEAARQAYAINLQQLEQNVPRELLRVKASLEDADAQLTALRKSTDSAEENLKLVEARVSLGEATQLDFLNAQSNLLSVRVGILNAINLHETARADLDHVTGRYLRFYVNDTR
jgi:outer membrane protein TolC